MRSVLQASVLAAVLTGCAASSAAPGWESEEVEAGALPGSLALMWQGQLFSVGFANPKAYKAEQRLFKFEDGRWRPLGEIIHGEIKGLAVWRNRLYACGAFTNEGPAAARNVAVWEGETWKPVGSTNAQIAPVESIVTGFDDRLYVAGRFGTGAQGASDLVLAWDGEHWFPPGGGVSFVEPTAVQSFVALPTNGLMLAVDVYSSDAHSELVHFDGLRWRRHRSSAHIKTLAVGPGQAVYGAGQFADPAPNQPRGVGRWDGQGWQPLGTGLGHPRTNTVWDVSALTCWRGALIAGGTFRRAGDVEANFIAAWDGTKWSPLGGGLDGGMLTHADSRSGPIYWETTRPTTLLATDAELLVFGHFTTAGGVGVHGAARWDGSNWRPFQDKKISRVSGRILGLASDGHSVIACGPFSAAGNVACRGLARWVDGEWKGFPSEVPPGAYDAITAAGDRVWVSSVWASGEMAGVLEWNGAVWKMLPGLVRRPGAALVSDGKRLYVGDNALRKWDGQAVMNLPALPVRGFARIHALALGPDGTVYAGTSGMAGQGGLVQAWNGATWQSLGNGPEGFSVQTLLWTPEGLFAGGQFEYARTRTREEMGMSGFGVMTRERPLTHQEAGIARLHNVGLWDGSQWRPLATGLQTAGPSPFNQAIVLAMAYTNRVLYVGGGFTHAGGVRAANIAAWNGQRWFPLGEGVKGTVHALAIHGEHLYVGGEFEMAGGKPAINFARWRLR